jgi:radical SAM protein with 4Fe4S-binding SPASM domain
VRVLAEAQSCGIREVIFTGGEPLLREGVLELADHARRLGLRVCLLTNGTLLEKHDPGLLTALFDLIFVSLDSCREVENDRLRGVGSYRRTLRGLQKLCGSKPEAVCLRPVVTRINVQSLSEMPEWAARNLGVKMILPTWYLPNSLAEVDELALFVGKESRHFLQAFADAAKTTGITNILDCIPFTTRGKCGAGSQIVSIDATGEVFPCQALHFSELSAGNVRNQSLKELGQAPAMRGMAEITVSSIAHCHDCGLAMVCGGGCRALAFALYRDIHAHNEFLCSILRQDAEERLWAESEKKRALKH